METKDAVGFVCSKWRILKFIRKARFSNERIIVARKVSLTASPIALMTQLVSDSFDHLLHWNSLGGHISIHTFLDI